MKTLSPLVFCILVHYDLNLQLGVIYALQAKLNYGISGKCMLEL